MYSPVVEMFFQYGIAAVIGLMAGLLTKAFIAQKMQGKIQGYQSEIVKSHDRILTLESYTDKLEKRVKELEGKFQKDRLILN